jgi:PAS domain S-box-containing protein
MINTAGIVTGMPVLIVEDDVRLQRVFTGVLTDAGYQVHAVSEAAAAIAAVKQHRYAAVLLDMRLPDNVDGSVLVRIVELDPTVPAIVVTGYGTEHTRAQSLKNGAFAHLVKPCMPEEILALLDRALAVRRLGFQAEKTAQALRRSEEQFRQVIENIHEVFWMSTPDKNEILYISPGYEKLWGRSCDSLYAAPKSWLEAIHPDDRPRVKQAALSRQVTGEYDEEYRIVRPDGTVRWILDRAFPVKDDTGRVYRIAGIAADISERKASHEALRAAYQKIESILTSMPAGIVIVNKNGQIVYTNALAEEHLNLPQGATIGQSLQDLLQGPWSDVGQLACSGLVHPDREGELEAKGRVYRYRAFSVARQASDHDQIGLVTWDITEEKQLQDQLIQADKLVSVGTLVFGVAHEINNPMQGILGMGEILLEEENPAAIKEYVRDIIAYTNHIATVVRELVAYARPPSRDPETDVDLRERLTEALKMVRRSPQATQIQAVFDCESVPCIRARRSEIDQIFVNLVSNAVQAMHGTGRLTLACRQQGGTVVVRVTDTGRGIPKALLTKVFDPFFTTKEPGQGTGLGLSIVQKLVTKYRGTIRVESVEGSGSTFTVEFPVPPAATVERTCLTMAAGADALPR